MRLQPAPGRGEVELWPRTPPGGAAGAWDGRVGERVCVPVPVPAPRVQSGWGVPSEATSRAVELAGTRWGPGCRPGWGPQPASAPPGSPPPSPRTPDLGFDAPPVAEVRASRRRLQLGALEDAAGSRRPSGRVRSAGLGSTDGHRV